MNDATIKLFFISGAPRSGTTFLSDWVTQTSSAYCVHEVLGELENMTDEDWMPFLGTCAQNGQDRYQKKRQLEFLRWQDLRVEQAPTSLGLKQPIVWTQRATAPSALNLFLNNPACKKILIFRHPYDVIASGKSRGLKTSNWPGYTTAEHCQFWQVAYEHQGQWQKDSDTFLAITWENLLLHPEMEKERLEKFLDIQLQVFAGFEHEENYFRQLKRSTTRSGGVTDNEHRKLLTSEDRAIIKQLLGDTCQAMGYEL